MPRPLLRALSFAHLLGHAGKNARAEDERDEDDKAKKARRASEDEEDDDKPQGRRAAEDEEDDDKPQGRRASEDEEDDDDKPQGRRAKGRRAEDDEDPDEEDERDPKGRRTAAEEDDEEQDEEDERDPKARAARRRERARCARIFGSKHAAGRVAAAAQMAFTTRMSASEAIRVLATLPVEGQGSQASGLGDRMAALGTPRPTGSAPPPPSGRQAVASSWDAAATRAGIRGK